MKTVGEIIARADSIRANPFTEAQKAEWVAQVDAKICADYLSKKYPTEGYRRQGDLSPADYTKGWALIKGVNYIFPVINSAYIDLTIRTPQKPYRELKAETILRISGLADARGQDYYNPELLNKEWTILAITNNWQPDDLTEPEYYSATIRLYGGYSISVPTWTYFSKDENPDMQIEQEVNNDSPDRILSVPEPWDELYVVHLLAQIDFYQGETIRHNAMLAKFQDLLEQYTAHLARQGEFEPKTIEDVPKIIY